MFNAYLWLQWFYVTYFSVSCFDRVRWACKNGCFKNLPSFPLGTWLVARNSWTKCHRTLKLGTMVPVTSVNGRAMLRARCISSTLLMNDNIWHLNSQSKDRMLHALCLHGIELGRVKRSSKHTTGTILQVRWPNQQCQSTEGQLHLWAQLQHHGTGAVPTTWYSSSLLWCCSYCYISYR